MWLFVWDLYTPAMPTPLPLPLLQNQVHLYSSLMQELAVSVIGIVATTLIIATQGCHGA